MAEDKGLDQLTQQFITHVQTVGPLNEAVQGLTEEMRAEGVAFAQTVMDILLLPNIAEILLRGHVPQSRRLIRQARHWPLWDVFFRRDQQDNPTLSVRTSDSITERNLIFPHSDNTNWVLHQLPQGNYFERPLQAADLITDDPQQPRIIELLENTNALFAIQSADLDLRREKQLPATIDTFRNAMKLFSELQKSLKQN